MEIVSGTQRIQVLLSGIFFPPEYFRLKVRWICGDGESADMESSLYAGFPNTVHRVGQWEVSLLGSIIVESWEQD